MVTHCLTCSNDCSVHHFLLCYCRSIIAKWQKYESFNLCTSLSVSANWQNLNRKANMNIPKKNLLLTLYFPLFPPYCIFWIPGWKQQHILHFVSVLSLPDKTQLTIHLVHMYKNFNICSFKDTVFRSFIHRKLKLTSHSTVYAVWLTGDPGIKATVETPQQWEVRSKDEY